MTTYINVHRVESVKVDTTNYDGFKTITITVNDASNEEGTVELTLFTYDFDLEIEG
jgi:hypothetical protein